MSATLMALYRRPEGGEVALATFRRRYAEEHLPLVRQTPGLRSVHVARVDRTLAGTDDLVLVARMVFDDRAALEAALASEPMRAAARTLREIAPGLMTMVVLEADPSMESGDREPDEPRGS